MFQNSHYHFRFDIDKSKDTLLLFQEDPKKPAATLAMSDLPSNTILEVTVQYIGSVDDNDFDEITLIPTLVQLMDQLEQKDAKEQKSFKSAYFLHLSPRRCLIQMKKRQNVHLATRSFVFGRARKPRMACSCVCILTRDSRHLFTLGTTKFKKLD